MENMTNHRIKKRISDCKIRLSALCWLFSLGSVIGFVLEGIWSVLRLGYWENHSATVWGPFCIVYGIGTVLLYLISALIAKTPLPIQFGIFALAGGAVEYFASWFQELVFGVSTWNYDHHFLNFGGRVSLQMVVIWGILGTLFARFIFPIFSYLFVRLRGRGWRIACACVAGFMVVNLLMSAAAILRWGERQNGVPASNLFESFLDQSYGDDRMKCVFSNMEFLK